MILVLKINWCEISSLSLFCLLTIFLSETVLNLQEEISSGSFLRLKRLTPLTPTSDQNVTSPYNFYKLSCKQVTRTDRLISSKALLCFIGLLHKKNKYLWSLDFLDLIIENHRYTIISSWLNTCGLVRQVFMHINYHTSSQFSSVKVMTRFLPLDLSFMNTSISSSSSAAVFLVAVPDLSAMLNTQRRNPTGNLPAERITEEY